MQTELITCRHLVFELVPNGQAELNGIDANDVFIGIGSVGSLSHEALLEKIVSQQGIFKKILLARSQQQVRGRGRR